MGGTLEPTTVGSKMTPHESQLEFEPIHYIWKIEKCAPTISHGIYVNPRDLKAVSYWTLFASQGRVVLHSRRRGCEILKKKKTVYCEHYFHRYGLPINKQFIYWQISEWHFLYANRITDRRPHPIICFTTQAHDISVLQFVYIISTNCYGLTSLIIFFAIWLCGSRW